MVDCAGSGLHRPHLVGESEGQLFSTSMARGRGRSTSLACWPANCRRSASAACRHAQPGRHTANLPIPVQHRLVLSASATAIVYYHVKRRASPAGTQK